MRFDLERLRARLIQHTGRKVSWLEVAKATGVHQNILYNLANNKQGRVDISTLAALLSYFRTQGLDVGPGDLFAVEVTPSA